VKGGDGEEEEDVDAAAALPHAAAPVGAPSVHHYSEGSNPSPNIPLPTTLPYTIILRSAFEREPCAPKTPCALAPTPTVLPGELEACSRPSRYAPRAEHDRRLAAQAKLISALPPPDRSNVFSHEALGGKYVPRAVLFDLEPGVIGAVTLSRRSASSSARTTS
jgi:hypothetical protein